jgi:hypothetical protein
MLGAKNFPALIRRFHAELKQRGERWQTGAHELAMRRLESPQEFLDWAKRDRHWSFMLAEEMRESSATPSDLAARLLVAMVHELEDEREMREQELGAEAVSSGVNAYAD